MRDDASRCCRIGYGYCSEMVLYRFDRGKPKLDNGLQANGSKVENKNECFAFIDISNDFS